MIFLFENFAESRLEGGALPTDLVLSIPAKDSNKFPSPASELQRFALVLYDGIQDPEICWATLNSGTGNIVVERGQEDTAPKHWRPGTAVINAPTKVSLDYLASGGSDSWHQELQLQIDQAFAQITAETQARLDQDGAFAAQLLSIETGMADSNAQVSTLSQAFAGISNAWAAYQIQIDAQAADAVAKATQALNTSVTTETAVATLKTEVEAAIGPDGAVFAEKIQALVDFDTAQVGINTDLETRFGQAEADLTEEVLLRSTQYLAQAEINSTLTAGVGENTARIAAEEAARADETQALAQRSSALEAEVAAGRGGALSLGARITDVETAAATATSALATRTDALEAEVSDATGVIGQAVVTTTQNAQAAATSAGAALTAQTQTATSANTALAAKASTMPPRLDIDGSNFTTNANGAATIGGLPEERTETVAGFGLVGISPDGATIYNRAPLAHKTGRIYRVKARVELVAAANQNARIYLRGTDGEYNTTGSPTSAFISLVPNTVTELTLIYGNPRPSPSDALMRAGTVWVRAGVHTQGAVAGGRLRIYEIYHEDITESSAAASSAATALTQASSASASAASAEINANLAASVSNAGQNLLPNSTGLDGVNRWTQETPQVISADPVAIDGARFIWYPPAAGAYNARRQSEAIPYGAGVQTSISAEVFAGRLTAGAIRVYIQYLNATGGHLGFLVAEAYGDTNGWIKIKKDGKDNPVSPAGTAQIRVNIDTYLAQWALPNSVAAWRKIKVENGAVATPWNDYANDRVVNAALAITAKTTAGSTGGVLLDVTGGAGGDPFNVEFKAGPGASSAQFTASKITLKNIVDGSIVEALSVQGGNAVLKGNLTAGSGIYLGSGTVWSVALRAQTFVRGDGETISFGGANIGLPSYEFVQDNLLPLGSGETYDLQLKNLTAAGGTVWAKINIPGAPSSQSLAGPGTVPGSGPTRQNVKTPKPDSTNGTYTISLNGTYSFTVLKNTEFQDVEGYVTLGLYAKKAGVWSRVGALTANWYTTVSNPSSVNVSETVYWGVTDTVQMGQGIEAFGASVETSNGPFAGRVLTFDSLGPITWSAPGTASSVKSALASGAKTSIKITPQG